MTMWAAAIAAILYLIKLLFGGAEFVRRLLLALFLLGDTERWPNGSTDLLSSLNSIYSKQDELAMKQDELGEKQAAMTKTQNQVLEEVKGVTRRLEEHITTGHH
ncbi:MAG TPA: hypothetical protein VF377_06855 [Acidimicrobiia bacterium]